MEGATGYGALFAQRLVGAGEKIVDLPAGCRNERAWTRVARTRAMRMIRDRQRLFALREPESPCGDARGSASDLPTVRETSSPARRGSEVHAHERHSAAARDRRGGAYCTAPAAPGAAMNRTEERIRKVLFWRPKRGSSAASSSWRPSSLFCASLADGRALRSGRGRASARLPPCASPRRALAVVSGHARPFAHAQPMRMA